MKVPDVLISGNHKEIEFWREEQMLKRTYKRRRDLIKSEFRDLQIDEYDGDDWPIIPIIFIDLQITKFTFNKISSSFICSF